MGRSLLSQFGHLSFDITQHPFIDSLTKTHELVTKIDRSADDSCLQPLVFSTLVDPDLRACLRQSKAEIFDFFSAFTQPLENMLKTDASPALGLVQGVNDTTSYSERIQAMDYAITNDDGAVTRHYDQADLILIGVSRSGKTPTCLYLGLQYRVLAANYPLTEDDLDNHLLPQPLHAYQDKLLGLSIEPRKLHLIRQQRRPQSRYASLQQCQHEARQAKIMFEQHDSPYIDTTAMSVEEIAARILDMQGTS